MRPGLRKFLLWGGVGFLAAVGLSFLTLFAYIGVITHRIDTRIEQLRSAKATAFYAMYPPMRRGQRFSLPEIKTFLADQGYVERKNPEELTPGEYAITRGPTGTEVYLFRPPFEGAGHALDRIKAVLRFEDRENTLELVEIRETGGGQPLEILDNPPKKVAAYFAGRLRTQNAVALSEIPVSVRLGVMAIEDVHFLEHIGVSFRGTLRALWKDMRAGRFVEGGSTLTQQLMKNLFFSREKAISRKLKEAVFAFVTETRHSKEEILEAYLNEVYMGQAGTHEIHGVSEGARYYFNRRVTQLSLAQGATLAAIIQAPNAKDPHKFADRTLARRNLVLKKMLDAEFILPDEYEAATMEPLGVSPSSRTLEDIDYSIDLVLNQLPEAVRKRLDSEPLAIYLTLNPYLQSVAAEVLARNVERLQKISPEIRKNEKKGLHLQGAVLAIDVKNCSVLALQGGTSYRQTQFNRVMQGKRQPGSLFKPFVFLAGFNSRALTPTTELDDAPFEWKYEGQTWTPKNYDKQFRGLVTARQALELSLNIPTARAAEKVGLAPIRDAMIKAGIKSNIPVIPSISLGSAEVSPFELAEAFTTIANLGQSCHLQSFVEVFDQNKNVIVQSKPEFQPALPPGPSFQTVHVMKGVFSYGTARSALSSGIPLQNFAGKTGTTNDAKDAWFVGFSPTMLTLVWIGYDEEAKVGLAGATAALPVWVDFVKQAKPFLTSDDFVPPEDLVKTWVDRGKSQVPGDCVDPQVEYFEKGTEPATSCLDPASLPPKPMK